MKAIANKKEIIFNINTKRTCNIITNKDYTKLPLKTIKYL